MRILIVSDTHRSNALYLQLVKKHAPLDMVIHCGDVEGSEYTIESAVQCPVHIVAGNNDFFSGLKQEDEFMIGKYKVMLTHGHHYYISMGNELLKDEAKSTFASEALRRVYNDIATSDRRLTATLLYCVLRRETLWKAVLQKYCKRNIYHPSTKRMFHLAIQ